MRNLRSLLLVRYVVLLFGVSGLSFVFWKEKFAENLFTQQDIALQKEDLQIQGNQPLVLRFVGDIMLDRGVAFHIQKNGSDWKWPFLNIAKELQETDFLFGNLESIISDKGTWVGSIYSFRANPLAIERNVRQVDVNLNRMFKPKELLSKSESESYEYRLAKTLKKQLQKADVLLDIHGSRTPDSVPFAIAESNAAALVKFLPVNIVVSGFDEFEPGGTDYFMNNIGKVGICIECGYNEDEQSFKIAEEALFTFLAARGHLGQEMVARQQKNFRLFSLYLTKTNFKRFKTFSDFEAVSENQVLGIDGNTEVVAEGNGVILFANRDIECPSEEAFLLAKETGTLT